MAEPRTQQSLRRAQAALTRSKLVHAARELFLANGYVETSVAAVAARAGAAVQTVYNSIGNKAALLSAVLDETVSGPAAPRPVPEFVRERARRAADVEEVVGVLADWFVEVHGRTAPVFAMIRQAAAVDPDVAELERRRAAQRLRNYGLVAAELRVRGGLAAGLGDDEAAARIFALGHPAVFRTLVLDGGWSIAAYREWLRKALRASLLELTGDR